MVGDRLTAFISIQQFFALLDQFGGYSGLKQAGGGGVLAGQLAVGLLAGVAYGGYARQQRRAWPLAAGIVAGLLVCYRVQAVAAGTLVRQLVQRATFAYDGTEYRGEDVQPITPNDRFYTVTKNIVDPDPSTDVWRLEIGGLVDRPRTYRFENSRHCPRRRRKRLSCASAITSAVG